jgi:hypothetical protein
MSIATAAALLFLTVIYLWIRSAANPLAATGIAMQTLAGFFASVQLWANSPSDSLLKWCARQVERNRWGVAGLLDGRLRSFLLAALWYLVADRALGLASDSDLPAVVSWPLIIGLLLLFMLGAVVLLLALLMFGAVRLAGNAGAPRGRGLIALRAQLRSSEWPWPIVGVVFLMGGVLQIAAS